MLGYRISFETFSWEAFATLVTGIAAVCAAVYIGWRQTRIAQGQVAIAERQAEILGKQTQLDELRLKSELFDRRFSVYDRARDLLFAAMQGTPDIPSDVATRFLIALGESRFLCRPAVTEHLREIWRLVGALSAVRKEMRDSYDRTGEYGSERTDRELQLNLRLEEAVTERLPEVFAPELSLFFNEGGPKA